MSRIGKKPIAIPKGVKVDPQPGVVEVQGPKGKLRQPLPAGIGFEVDGDQLHARALRAALDRSSRSGRVAKQFVDDLTGRLALERAERA